MLLSDVEPVRAVLERPHGLLEGPRFGEDGEAVYSDVIAGGVWRCSRDGRVREILPKRRGIGGLVAHAEGGWVLSGRSVLHVASDGELLAGVLRYRPLSGEARRARSAARRAVPPTGSRWMSTAACGWRSARAAQGGGAGEERRPLLVTSRRSRYSTV